MASSGALTMRKFRNDSAVPMERGASLSPSTFCKLGASIDQTIVNCSTLTIALNVAETFFFVKLNSFVTIFQTNTLSSKGLNTLMRIIAYPRGESAQPN